MKLFFDSCLLSLVGLITAARVASRQQLHQDFPIVNSTTDPLVDVFINPALGVDSPLPPPSPEAIWHKAYCRGAALVRAMSLSEEESNAMLEWPYTQSPWDGDLKPELRTWGYLDDDTEHAKADDSCDFDKRFFMKNIFAALGVDTRSADGGPNHCFRLQHARGPAVILDKNGKMPNLSSQRYVVGGKIYKCTGASSTIGINRDDGIVYFINRRSAEQAAGDLWNQRPDQVDKAELPKLRSSSDLAWGLWNRVPGEQKINMIMSLEIVNTETATVIVPRALRVKGLTEVQRWPGTDFVVGSDDEAEAGAALALIGSPNGLGAGYLLLQHKRQLGGANYIYKVKIFRNEDDDDMADDDPSIIFYVDRKKTTIPSTDDLPGAPSSPEGKAGAAIQEGKVVERSRDGKDLVREHIVWAKL